MIDLPSAKVTKQNLPMLVSGSMCFNFANAQQAFLQSGQFLLYYFMRHGETTQEISVTASRIQADSHIAQEEFARQRLRTWYQRRRLANNWNSQTFKTNRD